VLGPLALALAFLGVAGFRERPRRLLLALLLPATAAALLLAPRMRAALLALAPALHRARAGGALLPAWPHLLALWLETATLAPLLAALLLPRAEGAGLEQRRPGVRVDILQPGLASPPQHQCAARILTGPRAAR